MSSESAPSPVETTASSSSSASEGPVGNGHGTNAYDANGGSSSSGDGGRETAAGHSMAESAQASRTGICLNPDPTRVLFREFAPHTEERALKMVARVMQLSEADVQARLANVLDEFQGRHRGLPGFFLKRFRDYQHLLFTDQPVSEQRQMLIGSYFTQEYAYECAALFNPSMVWHPDQSGVPSGAKRFIISLRAVGEGHISSITFRAGLIHADMTIEVEPTSRFATLPTPHHDRKFDRDLFEKKIYELHVGGNFVSRVLAGLEQDFTIHDLRREVNLSLSTERLKGNDYSQIAETMLSLAESNYEVVFDKKQNLSERILFPMTVSDVKGLEDARFVEFTDDDGATRFYGTYTAYNGRVFIPQLLQTEDFVTFRMSTLNGPAVQNKGLGLFPRKLNGRYAIISRQDNENIFLMTSDNVNFWHEKRILMRPTYSWEFVQLGNCGSPIETDEGWLVLSHGVGPMRKYAIGAFLLDLDDPSRVIGRTRHPILSPDGNEREGYVPNVVYSCGGQIHNGQLIIPYAMADHASSFATMPVDDLIAEMKSNPI